MTGRRCPAVAWAVLLLFAPCSLPAQVARDSATDWLVSAGSEGERYLRTLQLVGQVPATPWSIRPLSIRALQRIAPADTGHPWAPRFQARTRGRVWVGAIEPELSGIVNTGFPYGLNDGPVWAGRGLTTVASAGVQGQVGPLEFVFAPQVFRAENAGFPLAPNGYTGPLAFADGRDPGHIDLPQRFGDAAYQRFDPGQSHVSLHAVGLSVGASTANEYWGPAIESPFLLGNNAAGFPHLFAGTDGPARLGPLTVGLRVIAGRLQQSDYAVSAPAGGRRSFVGVVGYLGIRQLPGLEIGGSRAFEGVYTDAGLGELVRPLTEGILKTQRVQTVGGDGTDALNQIVSLFARWAFPASGVEVYGELGRDDHSYDLRDLILEPDHALSYMFGLQRVIRRPDGSLLVMRGELLNTSISHLYQVRPQAPPYVHDPITQGLTQQGQVLGAPGGYGGGSMMLSVESLTPTGRRTLSWRRLEREPALPPAANRDVMHAVTAEWLMFRHRVDLGPEVAGIFNLNRNTNRDVLSLRVAMVGRAHW